MGECVMDKEQFGAAPGQNFCDSQLFDKECDCTKISRRNFMALTAVGATGVVLNSTKLPVIAGPF